MAILSWQTDVAGLSGVIPRIIYINTTDSVGTITTAAYLNNLVAEGMVINNTDVALVQSTTGPAFYQVVITGTAPNFVYSLVAELTSVGNVIAGGNGVAGYLASFSGTSAKGSLRVAAVANAGNTITTISNAAMGQASVVSIPDPGTATADFVVAPAALVNGNLVKASGTAGLVVDAGFAVKANTTAVYAGGGTTNTFTATGLTASSIVTAVNLASTNSVAITKAIPGTNTLAITWASDPGAGTTVSWIAITPAV